MNVLAEAATGLDALWVQILGGIIIYVAGFLTCLWWRKSIEAAIKVDLDGDGKVG